MSIIICILTIDFYTRTISSLNLHQQLTNKVYYFDWFMTPNVVWVDQGAFDWEDIPETLTLKPQNEKLVGNVLCDFETLDGEDPKLAMCDDEEVSTLSTSGGKTKMTALSAISMVVGSFLALSIVQVQVGGDGEFCLGPET